MSEKEIKIEPPINVTPKDHLIMAQDSNGYPILWVRKYRCRKWVRYDKNGSSVCVDKSP